MIAADSHPVLARAVELVRGGSVAELCELDHVRTPVYATDANGVITYYNAACMEFAGRAATVGEDRWCVTWRLLTDEGETMPHDQCPMAVAIRERREVRGLTAVAERPDGGRRRFVPYPTPVFGEDGRLLGAVNIFLDAARAPTAAKLRAEARRWRRVALSVDPQTAAQLEALCRDLERRADEAVTDD